MMMMNDPEQQPYTSHGWANGWPWKDGKCQVPWQVKYCQHGYPDKERKNVGRCVTKVICHACRYTYLIDSSD